MHRIPRSCQATLHGLISHLFDFAWFRLESFHSGDTATRNSAASANFITSLWYGFPKQSSNAVFCCLPRDTFQATIQRVSPTWATRPWWVSLRTRDASIESDLPLHLLNLDSVRACSHCDLVCHQLQCGFWIDLQNCIRIRHPLTNAAHIAERYAFLSDFVDIDFFFFARPTLSVTRSSGVATAQSGPTPSQNPMGSDATARPLSTGFWDGARGFLADPTPQTACSVIGTAPGVSMQTHPKLPSGPQANLVAHPHAQLSASCAWPSSWPSAALPAR